MAQTTIERSMSLPGNATSFYLENGSETKKTLTWSMSGLPSGATIQHIKVKCHIQINFNTINGHKAHVRSSDASIVFIRESTTGTYTGTYEAIATSNISSYTFNFRADTGVGATFSSFVAVITYETNDQPSTVAPITVTAGQTATITISNAKLSSLNHKLNIYFGNATSGVMTVAKGVGTKTYAIPLSWLNEKPDIYAGQGTIYCDTYNGSTLVGSTTAIITVIPPDSAGPSVTLSVARTGSVPSTWGLYIQKFSGVDLTASGSAQYGATIASVVFSDGVKDTNNTNLAHVSSITSSGQVTYSVTVTDSRGLQATASQTISVVPYEVPIITNVRVRRCNSSGQTVDANGYPLDSGTSISALASVAFPSYNNHNSVTIVLQVQKSDGTWINVATLTNGVTQVCSAPSGLSGGFQTNKIFRLRIIATDALGGQGMANTFVEVPGMLMHAKDDNSGMAFGMPAEREGFEFRPDWDVYVYGEKLINLIYPVGSIYMSTVAADPSSLFHGTQWEQIKGRFLLATGVCEANTDNAFGTIQDHSWNAGLGSTGGQDYHTLTQGEMPEHAHYATGKNETENGDWSYALIRNISTRSGKLAAATGSGRYVPASNFGYEDLALAYTTGRTGNNEKHNNMPPYLAVNMWKRIA